MAKIIYDDGLDEYLEQQNNTPNVTISAPTAKQQKSAERAEIEKSLELLKGIMEIQGEIRKTLSELTDMTEKVISLSDKLTDAIQVAKPIWDDLLSSFVQTIEVDEKSLERFNEIMLNYANEILNKCCALINKAVTENVTGQFTEVANKHLNEFDARIRAVEESYRQALNKLETMHNDSITKLEKSQGKLLAQIVEERNRIFLPQTPFWAIASISIFIILLGLVSWVKFWKVPGNDDAMDFMIPAIGVELIYFAILGKQWYDNKDNRKETESCVFSISMSEALYTMMLTISSIVYIVLAQSDGYGSHVVLKYLLPLAISSNFIWIFIKTIVGGILSKA